MSNCNCFIGYLSGEELFIDSFKVQVKYLSDYQKRIEVYGIMHGPAQTEKQLIDGRKGYLMKFNYCPYCGTKIDWKKLKSLI